MRLVGTMAYRHNPLWPLPLTPDSPAGGCQFVYAAAWASPGCVVHRGLTGCCHVWRSGPRPGGTQENTYKAHQSPDPGEPLLRCIADLEAMIAEYDRALDECRREFHRLVENLPDVLLRYDRDLRYVYVSPAIERVTGLPPSALMGRANAELPMPDDLVALWDAALRRVFESGQEETVDFVFPSPNGQKIYFESHLVPEKAPNGSVGSVLVLSRDVTTKGRAEQALRDGEAKYRVLVENQTAPDRTRPRCPRDQAG